ncbi:hypothetical protein [Amycolatopsis magusensis]|uniref:hypothetical protein n=1 Tax=Amycolatopsis magusensis TaxID=882444 RepID=UPI0037BCB132
MDLDSWSKELIAVLAVVAALLKLREVRGARVAQLTELKTVIEVANELPNGSAPRKAATAYVEEALNEFVRDKVANSRGPVGVTLALILLAAAGLCGYLALDDGSWVWWGAAAVFLIFGLTGLNQDAVRRERDARERPVRSANSSREGVDRHRITSERPRR